MTFLFKYGEGQEKLWADAFAKRLPEIKFKVWPHHEDPEDVRFLLFYEPVENVAQFKNLELLFTMSAGAEQVTCMEIPAHLRLVRMVEPSLTACMVEYVVGSALMLHREFPQYLALQKQRLWQGGDVPLACQRRIGVMGAGVLGLACLEALQPFGFPLSVWSRTRKSIAGVDCYAGPEELPKFLGQCDILICLLPLTPETRGILNAKTLHALPQGASLINVGRGAHVVEEELLEVLNSGHLAHAVLDVLVKEPLPEASPLWTHEKVWITPHIASNTLAKTGAEAVIDNIKRFLRNEPLIGEVDRALGY